MSNALKPTVSTRVGVVGAGQLARMMGEAAQDVGVVVTVLAESMDDSAVATCAAVELGAPADRDALLRLADRVDVITFDHELVDLDVLSELEASGVALRPSSEALRFAVDKAYQRRTFAAAGLPVPSFMVVQSSNDEGLADFLDELGTLPVVKASRGGYDGRGVIFPASRESALSAIDELARRGDVVVEERRTLLNEVAQLVVRALDGSLVFYPVVTTLQRDGMCVEVRYPSSLDEEELAVLHELSERVANAVHGVGVLAIEYFITEEGTLINEVALRPHNTGHWTIEGASASQFAQHLRAVSGQALDEVAIRYPHAVMVNVVGAAAPGSLASAQGVTGTYVHDYGKSWRPGRKLGHVTALGDEPLGPHVRAWDGARAYGTVTRET
ncbi:MAG: 5-(carboxyamino)imidazole ribonucleotide synthase [Acidimicrobiales bacterium]